MGAYKTATQIVSPVRRGTSAECRVTKTTQVVESKSILLEDLPTDVLEAILSQLNAEELEHCSCVCGFLRTAADSPRLWQTLCLTRWPRGRVEEWLAAPQAAPYAAETASAACQASTLRHLWDDHLQRWVSPYCPTCNHLPYDEFVISPQLGGTHQRERQQDLPGHEATSIPADMVLGSAFASWQEVYKAMHGLEPLIGQTVWSNMDPSAHGRRTNALVYFRWSAGCAQAVQLIYHTATRPPFRRSLAFVTAPGNRQTGAFATVHVVNQDSIVIKEAAKASSKLHSTSQQLSPAARAAADVAASGSSQTCGSPPGSFVHAMGLFMQNSVAHSRKRNGRKSGGLGGANHSPNQHFLQRASWQQPSAGHPLQGVWRMTFPQIDLHGHKDQSQVIRLVYDFSGTQAIIIGIEVTLRRKIYSQSPVYPDMDWVNGIIFRITAQQWPDSLVTEDAIQHFDRKMDELQHCFSMIAGNSDRDQWQVTSLRDACYELPLENSGFRNDATLLTFRGGALALCSHAFDIAVLTRIDGDLI